MAAFPDDPELLVLLRQWNAGDESALDRLLAKCLPLLESYIRQQLGDVLRRREETGDILHDALRDFLISAPRLELSSGAHLLGILYRIAKHAIADRHAWHGRKCRELNRERPLPSGTTLQIDPFRAKDPTPSYVAQQHENEARIRLALELLPPLDQRLIVLRVYEDKPFAEIAAAVVMNEDAVRIRFNRAMQKLAQRVKALERGDTEELLRE